MVCAPGELLCLFPKKWHSGLDDILDMMRWSSTIDNSIWYYMYLWAHYNLQQQMQCKGLILIYLSIQPATMTWTTRQNKGYIWNSTTTRFILNFTNFSTNWNYRRHIEKDYSCTFYLSCMHACIYYHLKKFHFFV